MPHPESGGIDQTRGRSAHSWQPRHLWKGVLKEKQAFITTATGLASLHLAVWRPESAHGPPDPALRAAPAELGGAGGGAASSQGASSHPGPPSEEPPKLPCPRRGNPSAAGNCHGNVKHRCLCQASFTRAHSSLRDGFFKTNSFSIC